MATFAIGDVQGCYSELQSLLDKIAFNPEYDRLWFVGDLVNRGPKSLETLRFIRALGDVATVVLGNHDLHLLKIGLCGNVALKRGDTLDAVLAAPDCADLLQWLRTRPLMHIEGDYALVHAGLLPCWSVVQARELAAEVEEKLSGHQPEAFLAELWGDQPGVWEEQLRGINRWRVVVNAMTRMRFCSMAGQMDFNAKGTLDSAPPGYVPWFAHPGRQSTDSTIIFGHWSALGLYLENHVAALDTGCVWGETLTALRLEDRRVFQVAADKIARVEN